MRAIFLNVAASLYNYGVKGKEQDIEYILINNQVFMKCSLGSMWFKQWFI